MKKIISIILLMAIVFADISMVNPQNYLANDNDYDVEYNQEEILDEYENVTDIYVDDIQQPEISMSSSPVRAAAKTNRWVQLSNGHWIYAHADDTFTKDDWEYIDGKWYHFNSNGWMQTGWLKVDGYWYHLDYDTGAMAIGWKYINGEYYYFNSSGIRQVGWLKDGNYWYYLNSDGIMQTGWLKLYGEWYYFNDSGVRQVGWLKDGGYWYHLDYGTGIMAIGWKYINGEYYYFNSSGIRQVGWLKDGDYWYHLDYGTGIMAIGWKYINGEYYYFNSSGIRQVGWLNDGGYWYHLDYGTGIMAIGWKYINGEYYYFNSSGIRQVGWLKDGGYWYHLDNNGIMQIGWHYIVNGWYYFDDEGVRQTGWLNDKGNRYYLNKDGIMQTGWYYIGDSWYYFNSDGNMNTESFTSGTRHYVFYTYGGKKGKLKQTDILIERVEQQSLAWCWIACSIMVGTYNTNIRITQQEVYEVTKGLYPEKDTAQALEEAFAISYISNDTKSAYISAPMEFQNIVSLIDNNCPLIVNVGWLDYDLKLGHSLVCSGYNLANNEIRLINPAKDKKTAYYSYKKLLTKLSVNKKDCRCVSMVYFNYKKG